VIAGVVGQAPPDETALLPVSCHPRNLPAAANSARRFCSAEIAIDGGLSDLKPAGDLPLSLAQFMIQT
jgi:hypothetical protein